MAINRLGLNVFSVAYDNVKFSTAVEIVITNVKVFCL